MQSPLLRLPPELRNVIYDYVCDKAVIIILSPRRKKKLTSTTPLKQTCRRLRNEVPTQAREAVVILRQGHHVDLVLKLLGLKHDAFSRAARPKLLRAKEISCAFGVQDPYRVRTNPPVTLLNCNVAGLVGRYLGNMRLVRVLFFRVGTERAGIMGLQDVFTKPELVEDLFR